MRRTKHVLSALLLLAVSYLVGGSPPALADLAHGTPSFTCSAPTQQIDDVSGALSALPTTGPQSLKEYRWYLDAQTTPLEVAPVTAQATCPTFQTVAGEIPSCSAAAPCPHAMRATAVNVSGNESARSNPVNFTVPVSTFRPVAPATPGLGP